MRWGVPQRVHVPNKGSYVVPFWVCYVFLVRDYNVLPQKELHRRVWVGPWDLGNSTYTGFGVSI